MTHAELAASRTTDAYMHDSYGEKAWLVCAKYLALRGLTGPQIEAVLRSKHMRWADDCEGRGNGKKTNSAAFRRYWAKGGEDAFPNRERWRTKMGAHSCDHLFKAKSKEEAEQKAKDFQYQEQHENGHGPYTGHLGTAGIGVQHIAIEFKTPDEAREWILENHNKWDLPMMAKCGDELWMLAGLCSS